MGEARIFRRKKGGAQKMSPAFLSAERLLRPIAPRHQQHTHTQQHKRERKRELFDFQTLTCTERGTAWPSAEATPSPAKTARASSRSTSLGAAAADGGRRPPGGSKRRSLPAGETTAAAEMENGHNVGRMQSLTFLFRPRPLPHSRGGHEADGNHLLLRHHSSRPHGAAAFCTYDRRPHYIV